MTLHKCGNAGCWNPDHLKQGLYKENMQDCINHKKFPASSKTHCIKGHEFTEANTFIRRAGWRICRTCAREYYKERKKKIQNEST